jgi:hypothetical protein
MFITDETESLERVLKYIDVTVVLHIMQIDFGGEDEIDAPWDIDDEDHSDLDDATPISESVTNILDLPVPVSWKSFHPCSSSLSDNILTTLGHPSHQHHHLT